MITILSPAKIQNFNKQNITEKYSMPVFMNEAEQIVEIIRRLKPTELSKLLGINANLTQLNIDRYFNWHVPFTRENAKQTALVFDGEAFRGLNAKAFTNEDFEYAQTHLRIFSGLYGVLRPLDLIQPYRIEVSTKLPNPLGKDLYAFWKEKVTKSIIDDLKKSGKPEVILNLASFEYFKTLDLKYQKIKIIDVEFFEYKNDAYRPIVIYTKKARGMMASYVIRTRIESTEDLKGFSDEGYWYNPQMSSENKLVFVR
jgi:cytoplasmic iron level regulating protein YaaA (DUF328/UPF0246 family)